MRGQAWAFLSPPLSPDARPRPDIEAICWTAYLAAWAGVHMNSQPPVLMDNQLQVKARCRALYQAA